MLLCSAPSVDNVTETRVDAVSFPRFKHPLQQRQLAGMNQDSQKTTVGYPHSNAAYAISLWLISYHFSLNRGHGALG